MTIQDIQRIVGVTADGINGPKTQAAIKAYQQMLGVTPDGIWGPITQAAYDSKINSQTTSSGGTSTSSGSGSSYSGSSMSSSPAPTYTAPTPTQTANTLDQNTTTQLLKMWSSAGSPNSGFSTNINGVSLVRVNGQWYKDNVPVSMYSSTTSPTNTTTSQTGGYTQSNPQQALADFQSGKITAAQYNTWAQSYTNSGATPTTPISTTPMGSVEDYNKSGDTATSLYGQTSRNSEWEQPAVQEESAIANAAGSSGLVSSEFLKTISADPSIVGFYVNALAYGGYTMGDILNDMKRRELISQGNTDAKTLKIIDPELNRNTYQSSADGQKSVQDTARIIPTFNLQGLLNPEILKYGANVPDELFKTLVPILDKNSQEFKDAVAKVKATYYDLATATLQATTEQEKAIADYNLKNFSEQINKQYGILLSDDATKAWSQIETLGDTMSTRGIAGSGIQSEGVDTILASTRKADQRLRDEKLTKEEIEKASFYTSSASSAQIAALTDEERQKYGLKPSPEILAKFSIASLKAQYPNRPDDEIKAMHDAVLDENGNYRSTLYSKYFSQAANTAITNQTNAEQQVLLDGQNKEAKAYRNYDQSQPFSSATPSDTTQMNKDAQTSTQSTGSNLTPQQSTAISSAINNFNTVTGAQLKPGESYTNSTGQTITQGTPISTTPSTTVTSPTTTYKAPTTTNTITTTPTTTPTSSNIINIDTNPGQILPSGQKYSYKGVVYTQP